MIGQEDPKLDSQVREALVLMGSGAAIAVLGAKLFVKAHGFRYFMISVGGVLAGRGLIRFFGS